MRFMDINEGLEIHHDGDLPARTGLGSSSSFTVGFLNVLYALKGEINLPCLDRYYNFQHLKKYGEEEYRQIEKSNKKNSQVMTITHN